MEKNEDLFNGIVTGLQAKNKKVVLKKMFGKHSAAINGNAFLCLFNGDLVFKLSGEAHASALKLKGSQLWDPGSMGRAMKEWVHVPEKNKKEFNALAEAAMKYVSTLKAK